MSPVWHFDPHLIPSSDGVGVAADDDVDDIIADCRSRVKGVHSGNDNMSDAGVTPVVQCGVAP